MTSKVLRRSSGTAGTGQLPSPKWSRGAIATPGETQAMTDYLAANFGN
jgi:hypothetical protein